MADTPVITLVVVIGVLIAVGSSLLLERSLTRVLLGVVVLSNGINLLVISAGGRAGRPPVIGETPEERMTDPLPQALVLTAIVITLGVTAFLLALAYRNWQLQGNDEVQDDSEDRRIVLGDERAELRAQFRQQRRELRAQTRAQKREIRNQIRAERRRMARAESDDLEGTGSDT